jgi:hypothetical protein
VGWTLLQIDNLPSPTDYEIATFGKLVLGRACRDVTKQHAFLLQHSGLKPVPVLLIHFSLLL